jgi:hypothetical protein
MIPAEHERRVIDGIRALGRMHPRLAAPCAAFAVRIETFFEDLRRDLKRIEQGARARMISTQPKTRRQLP